MDILISGSIAYDYLMRFPGKFADALLEQKLDRISVSFLVHDMSRHYGGVGANIAYTMALLGYRPRLLGTAGVDFGPYQQHLERVGVDTSTVIIVENLFTASFFCNTDTDNNQIAAFYGGAMDAARNYQMADINTQIPDLVVISPDDPVAMMSRVEECKAQGIKYLFDPSQQVATLDGEALRLGIENCHILMCNEYEWEVMQNQTGLTLDDLQRKGCIFIHTLGVDGSNIYLRDEVIHIPVFSPTKVVDPTGAGDAYRGGILRGLALGLPWKIAGRMGALSAAYVLENLGTQNHHFTVAEFVTRFRTQFDDEGALDALLETAKL